jgi:ATP-dependent DNA helicase RecG
VQYLKGIGPKRAKVLAACGIRSIEDLLYYFPRRYEDRGNLVSVAQLKEGQAYAVKAKVLAKSGRQSFRRRGFNVVEALVGDNSGKIHCVWFNQGYLKDYFQVGQEFIFYGKVERYGSRLQLSAPEFDIASGKDETAPCGQGAVSSLSIGGIAPVYSLPEGFTQRSFRAVIRSCLDECLGGIKDFLPFDIRSRNKLLNSAQALINIHFPQDAQLQKEAFRRLCFEEFFIFQAPLALRKLKARKKPGIAHTTQGRLLDGFISALPFALTRAQQDALREIKADMAKPVAMQRLLQGDVGCGKTVVATAAAIICIQGGYQAALMAPTEILAKQHYDKIKSQVTSHKSQEKEIKIGLLIGGLSNVEREKVLRGIKGGGVDLVIGTHALLEREVQFKNLGLVVIDEQHKFGVGQRALLPRKGTNPDVLIMTATPIPRTLAITIYGDLDLSVIRGMPPGRLPVKTLRFAYGDKAGAYKIARDELKIGRQAYVIYPLIGPRPEQGPGDGAVEKYEELRQGEFKGFPAGLIHGRLSEEKQDEVMRKFKAKELGLLVATTVLEVGIDIPNATCMIIEHAECFGLAQLHQLRGRIGRGGAASQCLLLSDADSPQAQARLAAMAEYSDGFRIAEEDLRIRGPGEFFGSRQHGLSELRIADPLSQMRLLKSAREEALKLVAADPALAKRQNIALKEKLLQRFPEYGRLMMVG